MNTRLLRMAEKINGVRRWPIPGYGNPITLTPSRLTGAGWGAALHWPARDAQGEVRHSVDLDRHLKMARAQIRQLLGETFNVKITELTVYTGPYKHPTMLQISTVEGHLTPLDAAKWGKARQLRIRCIQQLTLSADREWQVFGNRYRINARGIPT